MDMKSIYELNEKLETQFKRKILHSILTTVNDIK